MKDFVCSEDGLKWRASRFICHDTEGVDNRFPLAYLVESSVGGKMNCCVMLGVAVSVDAGLCMCNCRSELSANCVAGLTNGMSVVDIVWEVVVRGGSSRTPYKSVSSSSSVRNSSFD